MVSTLRNMLNINDYCAFSAECRQFGKKINVDVYTEVLVCTMHFSPLQRIKIHALLCYRTYIGQKNHISAKKVARKLAW